MTGKSVSESRPGDDSMNADGIPKRYSRVFRRVSSPSMKTRVFTTINGGSGSIFCGIGAPRNESGVELEGLLPEEQRDELRHWIRRAARLGTLRGS